MILHLLALSTVLSYNHSLVVHMTLGVNPYRIFLLSKTSQITVWRNDPGYDLKENIETAGSNSKDSPDPAAAAAAAAAALSFGASSSPVGNDSRTERGLTERVRSIEGNFPSTFESTFRISVEEDSVELGGITKEDISIEFDSYSDKRLIEYIRKVDRLLPKIEYSDNIRDSSVARERSAIQLHAKRSGSFTDLLKFAFGSSTK